MGFIWSTTFILGFLCYCLLFFSCYTLKFSILGDTQNSNSANDLKMIWLTWYKMQLIQIHVEKYPYNKASFCSAAPSLSSLWYPGSQFCYHVLSFQIFQPATFYSVNYNSARELYSTHVSFWKAFPIFIQIGTLV